jgi:hypothetical protein
MAQTLTGSTTVSLNFSAVEGTAATVPVAYTIPGTVATTITYANGSGANAADEWYYTSGSAAGSAVDIDLAAITTKSGQTGFTAVRVVAIWNDATTATHTIATGAGTNPFKPYITGTTPTLVVEPSSMILLQKPIGTAGWTVDGSNKVLRIDPGANTVAYRVLVIGS